MHQFRLLALSLLCLVSLFNVPRAFAADFGFWHTDIEHAKSVARRTGRPLLVIGNAYRCSHCDMLRDHALETSAFLQFARTNRLVLFKTTDDTLQLHDELKNTYRRICRWNGALPPMIYLFRVRDDAPLPEKPHYALGTDQVDLVQVTWDTGKENPYCGKFFRPNTTVFGVSVGTYSQWNTAMVKALVTKFFPNNIWNTPLDGSTPAPDPDPDPDKPGPDPDKPGPNPNPNPDTGVDPDDPGTVDPTPGTDEKEWLGIWLTDPAKAKTHALKNNRPLLVIGNAYNCTHCEDLRRQGLETPDFISFAKKNKLVLFKTTDDTLSIHSALKNDYRSICKWNGPMPPMIYLFKVRPTADLTLADDSVFSPAEVDLLKVTWDTGKENPYCGKFFRTNSTAFGVSIGTYSQWNTAMVKALVTKFFPNTGWSSMKPTEPGTDPEQKPDPDKPGPDNPDPEQKPDPENPDPGTDPDTPGVDPDNPSVDPTPGTDEKEWLGIWLTDPAKAKSHALKNNRPLLAITNAYSCAHCEDLRKQALETTDFINFAKRNKLVLFKTTNDTLSIHSKTKSTYQRLCKWNGPMPPFIYLFKVKPTADLTLQDENVFSPEEVELVKVTWNTAENPYCGKFFRQDTDPFGVHIGTFSQWDSPMVKALVTKFFPNTGWNTLAPPPTGPTGYEKALDFGRMANAEHQPQGIFGWGLSPHFENESLTGKTPERWYKLTGDQGKRYHFTLRGVKAPAGYPVWATLFTAKDGKPLSLGKQTLAVSDIAQLNHGFHFDTPKGSLKDQTYFLRINADTKNHGKETAEYAIFAHETVAAPLPGTITNPIWRHTAQTPQKPGQWSMDLQQATLKQAYDTGKPILLFFTGMNWCPYCLRMEHTVILSDSPAGQAFRNEIAKTYPILLDFQERNGTGPALLLDWQEDGYLKAHGITSEQATQQLRDNLALEKAFTLPGSDKVGYPSFVYCRVVKASDGTYELEAVGRFSDDILNPEDGTAVLRQLKNLYDHGHREASQFPGDLTGNLIPGSPASGTLGLNLGGPASEVWFKFTANQAPDQGKSWIFDLADAGKAPMGTEITFTVLDATGTQVLEAVSATLPELPHLLFVPESDQVQTDYWLKVASGNLEDVTQLQLAYEQKKVIAEVSLREDIIPVSREKHSVTLPLQVDIHRAPEQNLTFQYRVTAADTDAAPESHFTPVRDWQTFAWDSQSPLLFQLPVNVPENEPDWTGVRSFKVEFRSTDTCEIQAGTSALVHILALPAFIPQPQTDVELFCGLAAKIDFPVCVTEGTTAILGKLPKGLTYVSHLDDPDNPRITLLGRPVETVENVKSEIFLAKNDVSTPMEPHKLTLSITIKDAQIPSALIKAFAGSLLQSKGGDIKGLVTLEKNDRNMTITVSTGDYQQPLTESVLDWTGYDPVAQKLTLRHRFADQASLEASVDAQGFGNVTFTNPQGFKFQGELLPVASKPASYAGTYNVALRRFQDVDGLTEGWASIRVDATGKAVAKIQLYYETITGTVETFICERKPVKAASEEPDSILSLFLPLDWSGNAFQSQFAGTLNIVPASRRIPNAPSTWISGCDYENSALTIRSDLRIPLSPCGTLFNPRRSIMECVQEENLVFVSEPIADLQAIIPNFIRLREVQKFSFRPLPDQGMLATSMNQLQVSEADGTFTMALTALLPQADTTVMKTKINVTGIMVPTKSDCCGDDVNIAVGYGYFRYPRENGKIYRIRLFPATLKQYLSLNPPTVAVSDIRGGSISASCQADDNLVICQNVSGDTRIVNLTKTQGRLSLPGQTAWNLAAISARQEKTESQPVTLRPIASADLTELVFNPAPDAEQANGLQPGWNLIAVPLTVKPLPGTVFQNAQGEAIPAFRFDERTQSLIRASQLQAGYAYWLYVHPGKPLKLTYKALSDQQAETPVLPGDWGLRARPDKTAAAMTIWKFQNGRFVPVSAPATLKPTEGVWIHVK